MDWKEYSEQPAEGTFEKIRKRLTVRRAWRLGGVIAAVMAVVTAAAIVFWPIDKIDNHVEESVQMVALPTEIAKVDMQQSVVECSEVIAATENKDVKVETRSNIRPIMVLPEKMETALMQIALPAHVTTSTITIAIPTIPLIPPEEKNYTVTKNNIDENVAEDVQSTGVQQRDDTVVYGSIPTSGHEDGLVWAPNVIVPDGDEDANRYFNIKSSSDLKDFRVQIFNRRGLRLYTSIDPNFVWDATYDGSRLPQGGYVWVATFRVGDSAPMQRTGTVLVVR